MNVSVSVCARVCVCVRLCTFAGAHTLFVQHLKMNMCPEVLRDGLTLLPLKEVYFLLSRKKRQ